MCSNIKVQERPTHSHGFVQLMHTQCFKLPPLPFAFPLGRYKYWWGRCPACLLVRQMMWRDTVSSNEERHWDRIKQSQAHRKCQGQPSLCEGSAKELNLTCRCSHETLFFTPSHEPTATPSSPAEGHTASHTQAWNPYSCFCLAMTACGVGCGLPNKHLCCGAHLMIPSGY